MKQIPSASIVGSLIYVMVCTRPDIVHVIRVVSRFMSNLEKEDLNVVKWNLQYLKGSMSIGIFFEKESHLSTVSFVDSNFVGDLNYMRSTT